MNYKAMLLGFLLLLPVGLLAAIHPANASHGLPGLYINPPHTKFFGPCIKSTTFTISVNLWNSPDTGDDIFAFDFILHWGTISGIKLVSGTYSSPWANFFEVANSTSDSLWHLALTATPPSTGVIAFNAPVLTLTFHVEKDLCWPDNSSGSFTFSDVTMSSDGTKVVPISPIELDIGTYEQYSVQPNMELSTTDPAYNVTTGLLTEKCASHTFDIRTDLTNVTNLYGFGYFMTYNPDYLETDVQMITPKPTFAGPYEYTAIFVGPTDPDTVVPIYGSLDAGQIMVVFIRPSEKAGICGAVVPAVDTIFHTIWTANTTYDEFPTAMNTTIDISWGFMLVKCDLDSFGVNNQLGVQFKWDGPGEYNSYGGNGYYGASFGYAPSWWVTNGGMGWNAPGFIAVTGGGLILGDPITYAFKPSKYDLNLDCVVDVQDLKVLLPYYGSLTNTILHLALYKPLVLVTIPAAPDYHGYGDLYNETTALHLVDIFDFVAIAKNFGPVDP